jgi:hypothetical protein
MKAPDRGVMSEATRSLRRARNLGAILLLQFAASCSAWRPLPGVGLARPEGEQLGHARVLLHDGTELDLEDATIRPDSIIGRSGATSTRMAAARSDVERVDTRRTDATTTYFAGASATVLFMLLVFRISS